MEDVTKFPQKNKGKINSINKKDQQLKLNQQGFFHPCSITLTLFKMSTSELFSSNFIAIAIP